MRSFELTAPRTLELREIPVPEPGPNEVLVRVVVCAVCNGTDLATFRGEFSGGFGHELAGVVEEVGPAVSYVAPGDRVLCIGKSQPRSGYSEWVVVPEGNVVRAPRELDFEAIALGELLSVVAKCVARQQPWGEPTVIFGLGPAGIMVTQLVRTMAAPLITTDPIAERCELSLKFGADASMPPQALADYLKQAGLYRRVAMAYEAAGSMDAFRAAIDILREDGNLGVIGAQFKPVEVDLLQWERASVNLVMTATWPSTELRRKFGGMALRLLEHDRVDWRRMITHRFRLEDLPQAIALIEEHPERVCKAVIHIGQG